MGSEIRLEQKSAPKPKPGAAIHFCLSVCHAWHHQDFVTMKNLTLKFPNIQANQPGARRLCSSARVPLSSHLGGFRRKIKNYETNPNVF